MTEFERGYEAMRRELTDWSKARFDATGDRRWLNLVASFYEDMAAYHEGHAGELQSFVKARSRKNLRLVPGAER